MMHLTIDGPAEGDLKKRARDMVRMANTLGISVVYGNGYPPAVNPGDDPFDIAEQWQRAQDEDKRRLEALKAK